MVFDMTHFTHLVTRPRGARLRALPLVLASVALLVASGCARKSVVHFHVLFSSDLKNYLEPCT